jgi:thiol-disulfide isomerase/thioredoxin
MLTKTRLVAILLLTALLVGGRGTLALGMAELTVRDVDGIHHRPVDATGKRATVLFFIAHDCPIANSYAPEINRICAEYAARRIGCYVVYVEPDLPARMAREHAKAYGYSCPALLDPGHVLVKKAGATVTPEAAVFAPGGRLLYRGRIDDQYLDFGKSHLQPTTRDLRSALDCVVAGKPVRNPCTKAVGCFIPGV